MDKTVKCRMRLKDRKKHSVRFDPEAAAGEPIIAFTSVYLMNEAWVELDRPEAILVEVRRAS